MIHVAKILRVFHKVSNRVWKRSARFPPWWAVCEPRIPPGGARPATNAKNFCNAQKYPLARLPSAGNKKRKNFSSLPELLSSREARIPNFPLNDAGPHVFSLQGALGSGNTKEGHHGMIARTLGRARIRRTIAGRRSEPASGRKASTSQALLSDWFGRLYRERYYRGYSDYYYSGPRVYSPGRSYDSAPQVMSAVLRRRDRDWD